MGVSLDFMTFCNKLRMDDEVVENIRYRTKRIIERYNNYTGNGQSALLQAVKEFWNVKQKEEC